MFFNQLFGTFQDNQLYEYRLAEKIQILLSLMRLLPITVS